MINDIFEEEEGNEDEPPKQPKPKINNEKQALSTPKENADNSSDGENDFDNGNSNDPDFDVGGESALPDDNDITQEAEREKERLKELEQRKAEALARYGGQKLKRGNVDSSKIAVNTQGSNL